ncbi:hypothetical protein ONZ51_g3141 [Trametes cubensis]|uniref:F-box domain-containing protein n=1 Tax=Trametes cubensis TaxID=1111947 RepID=A0AAD7TYD3_9APHY|nr:hypothetical protein ONZ51_g3141 [Trametes cubensis]
MSAPLLPSSSNAAYVCDTLPAPRLATDKPCSRSSSPSRQSPPPVTTFDTPIIVPDSVPDSPRQLSPPLQQQAQTAASSVASSSKDAEVPSQPPARKLCVRHQRMADEGTNLKLQQLSLLTEQLAQLIRIDPFTILPREVSLKILGYLDATSLCRAAQVSRQWKSLADDDILWRGICEQHIGQKCLKCGWGLPILEKRRAVPLPASPSPSPHLPTLAPSQSRMKRRHEAEPGPSGATSQNAKRQRLDEQSRAASPSSDPPSRTVPPTSYPSNPLIVPSSSELPAADLKTRPWKDVYCERLTIERNWRRGRCTVRTLKGHTDGVMCLQFSETLAHPSFPVLITGSYDRTARVWNLETGAEVHSLVGHTPWTIQCASWNWRTGQCVKILEGHTEGVVCLNFDSNVLASGSVDTTVKVWNFRTGECFTLRGHCDWVNAVQLWDSTGSSVSGCGSAPPAAIENGSSAPQIDPGKMLFSASDDGTIRLWDLSLRTCVRQFRGHVGQVQSLKLLLVDEDREESSDSSARSTSPASRDGSLSPQPYPTSSPILSRRTPAQERGSVVPGSPAKRQKPVLISGSLDNTIKIWDIETGKAQRTLFGHIEGVWAVASDKLRLVSGSHDRTIKVWSREEGNCTATLVGHRGAVTCLALGEDKIVSGSDDGDVRVWSFSG